MNTILCSPDNFAWVSAKCNNDPAYGEWRGLPVRAERMLPTWKTYPRPKWWRRWFLREKQRAPERLFYVVDLSPMVPFIPKIQAMP